jgi:hypothetical protein
VIKILLIVSHVLLGVLGTVCAMLSLHHLIRSSTKKFVRYAVLEFVFTLSTTFTGGLHYENGYQEDKKIILNGSFPLAHSLFMEVKEHLFITLLLISLFLQVRIHFTRFNFNDRGFQREGKTILVSIIILGLLMSLLGVVVNMGFRINQ